MEHCSRVGRSLGRGPLLCPFSHLDLPRMPRWFLWRAVGESHCYIWGSCHVKLFRRFLPFKTTLEWPSSDSMAAEGARKEVIQQLTDCGWDPEDLIEDEDFDLNVTFSNQWSTEDSFAIIAGMLSPEEDFVWSQDAFNFPHFAHMERSSLDSELILRLHEEHTFPPIFPITAEGLMVRF